MKTIAISKFKATCLAVLDDVHTTREPVVVTKFGKPVAEIGPPRKRAAKKRRFGQLEGKLESLGDIISPAFDPDEWDMNR